MAKQLTMFDAAKGGLDLKDLCALDEMFSASQKYRSDREYMKLLKFISMFRSYAPFNCLLMHIQNPNITFVASAGDWRKRFKRYPKRHARPLLILQPFGPVMFLYDLEDTEGAPVPEILLKPFNTVGTLPERVFFNTVHNCGIHRIEVQVDLKGTFKAGSAVRLNGSSRAYYKDLNLSPTSNYLVLLNANHSIEEKYSTLAHELGHIFCGHVGVDELSWWEPNVGLSQEKEEIEAESVAYLVCRRQGLRASSEKYLSRFKVPKDSEIPFFGLNAVLQATDYIEKMGESAWSEPKRKPKKRSSK